MGKLEEKRYLAITVVICCTACEREREEVLIGRFKWIPLALTGTSRTSLW